MTLADTTIAPRVTRTKLLTAAVLGNMLEIYDFSLFGFFAALVAPVFFPLQNDTMSLLLTVATFGIGAFARPVGAVYIGSYADRYGRRAALSLTILVMAFSTAFMGIIPSYASIGWLAPLLVVLARVVQGFAAGGELGGSMTYAAEHAPPRERGFFVSFVSGGSSASSLIAAFIGLVVGLLVSDSAMHSWGWRVPFLLGGLIGPIGYYIRAKLPETPDFQREALQATLPRTPLRDFLSKDLLRALPVWAMLIPTTVFVYLMIYMPTYAIKQIGLAPNQAFSASLVGSALMFVAFPLFGILSDRTGRKPTMYVALILGAVLVYPAFLYVSQARTLGALMLVQCVFSLICAAYTGPGSTLGIELFPVRNRMTAVSICFTLAIVLFGTLAPFNLTLLIAVTGSQLAPAYYVIGACVVGLIGALVLPDRAGLALAVADEAPIGASPRLTSQS